MLFGELSAEAMCDKISQADIRCYPMFGTVFYAVYPESNKATPMKKEYKPDDHVMGIHSEFIDRKKKNSAVVQQARENMREHELQTKKYDNPDASLKLHLSLNNITKIDEEIILGLIQLLKEESESPDNNMSFFFKYIAPDQLHRDPRFEMNDQITIYFDKYSSTGDLKRLADKIDKYLTEKGVPQNTQALGPKDKFGINSFVSARFDNNKLLSRYNVYPFFDLELQKLFAKQTQRDLDNLPLCAFEAVFINIISSQMNISSKEMNEGLSQENSIKVQAELDKMIKDPQKYMSETKEPKDVEEKMQQMSVTSGKKPTFEDCLDAIYNNDLEELQSLLKQDPKLAQQTNERGWTLLHYTATSLQLETSKFLLEQKADPAAQSKNSQATALTQAASIAEQKLSKNGVIDQKDIKLVDLLALHSPKTEKNKSAVLGFQKTVELTRKLSFGDCIAAIRQGDLDELKELLLRDPELVKQVDSRGLSLLHHAANKFQLETITFLLDQGVNPDLQTNDSKSTALKLSINLIQEQIKRDGSASDANIQFVRYLYERSSEETKSKEKENVLKITQPKDQSNIIADQKKLFNICIGMIQQDDLDKLKTLLQKDPGLIHLIDDNGWSLLHHAAQRLQLETVRFLLDQGANPNLQTNKEKTTALKLSIDISRRKKEFNGKFSLTDIQLVSLLNANSSDETRQKEKNNVSIFMDEVTKDTQEKELSNKVQKKKFNSCISAIHERNLNKLKVLVEEDPAITLQVDARGWSLLHHAVGNLQPEIAAFLLTQKEVNPDLETYHKITALKILIEQVLIQKKVRGTFEEAHLELVRLLYEKSSEATKTKEEESISKFWREVAKANPPKEQQDVTINTHNNSRQTETNTIKTIKEISQTVITALGTNNQMEEQLARFNICANQCNALLRSYKDSKFFTAIFQFKDFLTGRNITDERQKIAGEIETALQKFSEQIKKIAPQSNQKAEIDSILDETLKEMKILETKNQKIKHGGRLSGKITDIKTSLTQLKQLDDVSDNNTPAPGQG